VKRLRIAIVGFGRLGRACAAAILDASDLEFAGVVRHASTALPAPFAHARVAGHIRNLENVEVALVCVPTEETPGVALELLQCRTPIVECSQLAGHARLAHYEAIQTAARRQRVPAIVGAGWDPGALPLLQRLFEVLIPHGQASLTRHPGIVLHHSPAIEGLAGVEEALIGEFRDADDKQRRYVYLRPAPDADVQAVRQAIKGDPLFADEATEVFALPDLSSLEAASGLVIERRGSAASAVEHPSLSLDARFDVWNFAGRVMVDATRAIPYLRPGSHRYALGLSGMPTVKSPS
jgi:diaminopimelate dehydrogenase